MNANMSETGRTIAPLIDHTLLKPDATRAQIDILCAEARTYGFASVCILPFWLPYIADALTGSTVKPCTVIGFPLGGCVSEAKVCETHYAILCGAKEIDMVIAIPAMKDKRYKAVSGDIAAVVRVAGKDCIVKVIIETCLLTDEEKRTACKIAVEAGAAFVKTSTGFSTAGATEKDVQLMRLAVPEHVGVKASGGIRSQSVALAMIKAGANRLGTSASVAIVTE